MVTTIETQVRRLEGFYPDLRVGVDTAPPTVFLKIVLESMADRFAKSLSFPHRGLPPGKCRSVEKIACRCDTAVRQLAGDGEEIALVSDSERLTAPLFLRDSEESSCYRQSLPLFGAPIRTRRYVPKSGTVSGGRQY